MGRVKVKAFRKQNLQDLGERGQSERKQRRGSKCDSLGAVQQVGDGTVQSDKELGRHSAELGALQVQVPVRHPRRAT